MDSHRSKSCARALVVTACLCGWCWCATGATMGVEPLRPFVVGHRGLLHDAPENTLAGFRAALSLRVGFEVDVRRTKDGELVCLHDATVDRTTDGKGPLNELTLTALSRLDAGG